MKVNNESNAIPGTLNRISYLKSELEYALSGMKNEEIGALFKEIIIVAGHETWNNKKQAIQSTVTGIKKLGKFILSKGQEYKEKGIKDTFTNDIETAKNSIKSLPGKLNEKYQKLQALSQSEKSTLITEAVIYVFVFVLMASLTAGGPDLEGGLPDVDLNASIGLHRHPFTHSILIGFSAEIIIRIAFLSLEKIHSKLPDPHDGIWDEMHRISGNVKAAGIAGMWTGLAMHLLKDSNLLNGFQAKTKAYSSLPISVSDNTHQLLFGVNAAASGAFGKESIDETMKNIK